MKLDRALQLEVLRKLRDSYPERVQIAELAQLVSEHSHPNLRANLHYLAQHGRIDCLDVRTLADPTAIDFPKITAKGLDYLEKHGGVSDENDPDSPGVFHWTARLARLLMSFYTAHWKWIWTILIALIGTIISVL